MRPPEPQWSLLQPASPWQPQPRSQAPAPCPPRLVAKRLELHPPHPHRIPVLPQLRPAATACELPVSHFHVSHFGMGTRGPECVRGCARVQGCERCEDGGAGERACESVRVGCMCMDMGVGVGSLCGSNLADLMAARAVEHSCLLPVASTRSQAGLAGSGGGWSLDLSGQLGEALLT